ncbi:hypothetical protein EJB05_02123, partial [Eragrostis curvula]
PPPRPRARGVDCTKRRDPAGLPEPHPLCALLLPEQKQQSVGWTRSLLPPRHGVADGLHPDAEAGGALEPVADQLQVQLQVARQGALLGDRAAEGHDVVRGAGGWNAYTAPKTEPSAASTSAWRSSKWKNLHHAGARASGPCRFHCRSRSRTYTPWTRLAITDRQWCGQFLAGAKTSDGEARHK